MGIPANTIRIAVNGHLGEGEAFTWGIWVSGDTPVASQEELDGYATGVATAVTASNVGKSLLAADGGVDNVRLYAYNAGGSAPAEFISTAPAIYVGTGTATLPLQCAVVCSIRTDLTTARGRGRFYLPADAVALTAHQMTEGTCTTVGSQAADFCSRVNALFDTKSVAVVSTTSSTAHIAQRIVVDSRIDIQRRRANKQIVAATVSTDITTG